MGEWQPPPDWLRIRTIESHTGGEPFRVIVEGFPDLHGATLLDRRRYAKEHHDPLRQALMWEPRGHADMYGGLVMPALSSESDLAVLFLHNDGFSTMCGHGVIALVTVALETGMLPQTPPISRVRLETPAGLVTAEARHEAGRIQAVSFRNVPSFALALDQEVEVPGLGAVSYDLAFGGAFYAFVEAAAVGLTCSSEDLPGLIEKGRAIKQAVARSRAVEHPFAADLSFLYGIIFLGQADSSRVHSRNVCVFADGEVDRSPTGTGVSARLAVHHARGQIDLDEPLVIESILGSRFTGRVVETTQFGPYPAVIPEVAGRAHIVGRSEFFIDPDDPLRHGFLLR